MPPIGAYLNIYGGTITGQVTLAYSAYGYVSGNPTIDFDISTIGPDAGARVSYLNRLSNRENANFTLTVSETQAVGTYTLATGASYFSNDILVRTANGDQIDVLTVVGNVVRLGDITFAGPNQDVTHDLERKCIQVGDYSGHPSREIWLTSEVA